MIYNSELIRKRKNHMLCVLVAKKLLLYLLIFIPSLTMLRERGERRKRIR